MRDRTASLGYSPRNVSARCLPHECFPYKHELALMVLCTHVLYRTAYDAVIVHAMPRKKGSICMTRKFYTRKQQCLQPVARRWCTFSACGFNPCSFNTHRPMSNLEKRRPGFSWLRRTILAISHSA